MQAIYVYCSECYELKDESTVEILDCCEDWSGDDWLTFRCPDCQNIQQSHRVSR